MEARKNIIDLFVEGAFKGWNIGIRSILPNVVMAFCLIQVLQATGALDYLAAFFRPLMVLFSLPGEAIMVNFAAMLSQGGAVGVAAGLFEKGILSATQLTIIMPAIFIGGGWVQYMGRILGTAGSPSRFWALQIVINIFNAFVAMFLMQFIV